MCDGPCRRWVGEECYVAYGAEDIFCVDCRPPPPPPTRPPPGSASVAPYDGSAHAAGVSPSGSGGDTHPKQVLICVDDQSWGVLTGVGEGFGSGDGGAAGDGDEHGKRYGVGRGSSSGACAPPVAAWRRVVQRAVASESSRSGPDRIDNLYGLLRDCWRDNREPSRRVASTRPAVPQHLCDQFWAEVAIAKEHRRARDQLILAQRHAP